VPDPIWQKAFSEEAAVSRVLGIYLGHNLTLTADIIEVSLLENSEQAVVGAIRNVIAKANSTSARYAAELQRQTDAEEQRRATAAAQMQRVRDKYPDGI